MKMCHSEKCCKRCSQYKVISEFYRHSRMKDGHLNICIDCTIERIRRYSQENRHLVAIRDAARARNPNRIQRHREYLKTEKGRAAKARAATKYRLANKHKINAQLKARRAIAKGILVRKPCYLCRAENTQAHHHDYNKPLEVVWLCSGCHAAVHLDERVFRSASVELSF